MRLLETSLFSGRSIGSYVIAFIGILLALVLIVLNGDHRSDGDAMSQTGIHSESQEQRVKLLLEEMEGVENVTVMLRTDSSDTQVCGVAVICSDGENPTVQEKIIRILRALYGIGSHQISVSG